MEERETPLKLGYSMPAEWEKHEATWLSWPKNHDSFPDEILRGVEEAYVKMVNSLSMVEKVNILIYSAADEESVAMKLEEESINRKNVNFHRIKTADVWFRDYGPLFIKRNSSHGRDVAYTHWKFNAWGNKYDDLKADANVPKLMPLQSMKHFDAPMVLEGGSIDVNGMGACLATEQCLLNNNRNPELDREEIEKNLYDYLGVKKMIWLKRGVAGDDTDGHVDDVARFVSEDTVVCAVENDKKDENYAALKENYNILRNAADQDGKRLNVARLPMPGKVEYMGQRLPASYTNFYIANDTVLVPIFNDRNDVAAMKILKGLFSSRKIEGVDCRELVCGFGGVHCVTQQQPA